jgi:phosphoribosylaminoimidazole carboxylase PurE protein
VRGSALSDAGSFSNQSDRVGRRESDDKRHGSESIQGMTVNKQREVRVGVLMGSDTDLPVMSEAGKVLDKFGIGYEMEVMSAHRTPVRAHEYATTAQSRGLKVLIAAAGAAAHLAGVIAANTTLPVIGVPMGTSSLNGLDALLSTVQMPGGIPVATMAIDKAGAVNAAIFAAEILGLSDPDIARKLVEHKEELARSVTEKNARLQQQLAERK